MSGLRYGAIRVALQAIAATGLDRMLGPRTRGLGCILTFHRVTHDPAPLLPENAGLYITPEFLDVALDEVKRCGYDIIALDALPERMAAKGERPFVVLTFDDGYKDLRDHALPVLKAHDAPFAAFICTGFADRAAPLWWLDLEDVVQRAGDMLEIAMPHGLPVSASLRSTAEKQAALRTLYWRLRALDEPAFRQVIGGLQYRYQIEPTRRLNDLCLEWSELEALVTEPLLTLGAHSMTHPRIGLLPIEDAEREMRVSRDTIAAHLGITPKHFCYPVGDQTAAGAREAEIARRLGYVTALTTRPGVLREGLDMQLLPRISVNGLFQNPSYLRALISGVPFMLR
ncbi:MAG: polysaccharide deacetylase family protein [Proteobacteria bacterium]|nr:polysaccharide deacetylase family protein [Pseudomonadota bacterium]